MKHKKNLHLLCLNCVYDEEYDCHKEHEGKAILDEYVRLVHEVPFDIAVPKETPERADVCLEQIILVVRTSFFGEIKDARQSKFWGSRVRFLLNSFI